MARWNFAALAALLGLALPAAAAPQPQSQVLCVAAPITEVQAAKLPHVGEIMQAHSCRDRESQHLFFATQVAAVKASPDLGASEVHFYQFTQGTRGWRKRWEARDFAPGAGATLRIHRFEPLDLDNDGLAETYLAYTVSKIEDVSDEAKLLIYHQGRKAAIRGVVARRSDDYASRSPDAAFAALPRDIQDHAFEIWDSLSLPPSAVK